jgi:hypothetical protein
MVGALVLVEVTVGITDASMTRSPSRPWTHSRRSRFRKIVCTNGRVY